ncbi:MAG: HAD family hydrolase [Bacteroidales bacterium]
MEIINRKSTIIFDLFDTLTDHETNISNLPPTSELLGVSRKEWNDQLLLHSRDRLVGKIRDPFLIIKKMANAINPEISDSKIEEVTEKRRIRFEERLIKIPDENLLVLEKLKSMKKKIVLLSNADVLESLAWNKSPLSKYFDFVFFSCDVGYAKPDLEIYQLCLDRISESASNCVFIGDGGSNELVAAKQSGIETIFISGIMKTYLPEKVEERKKQSDFHIEYLHELMEQ